jgi:hypothetical protein
LTHMLRPSCGVSDSLHSRQTLSHQLVCSSRSQYPSHSAGCPITSKQLPSGSSSPTTELPLKYISSRRGETVIAGLSMHMLGYIFNRIFTELGRRNVSYFGVVWTQIFGTFSHPLNISWMSLTCDDSEERALAMAL